MFNCLANKDQTNAGGDLTVRKDIPLQLDLNMNIHRRKQVYMFTG